MMQFKNTKPSLIETSKLQSMYHIPTLTLILSHSLVVSPSLFMDALVGWVGWLGNVY
jgi:hypothetical protein